MPPLKTKIISTLLSIQMNQGKALLLRTLIFSTAIVLLASLKVESVVEWPVWQAVSFSSGKGPTWNTLIISWSSWARMWQCQLKRPGLSKKALMVVTCPGSAVGGEKLQLMSSRIHNRFKARTRCSKPGPHVKSSKSVELTTRTCNCIFW